MKQSLLFLNYFLLFSYLSYSQSGSMSLPSVTPPSPEAASFAKFSETPVSYYTGLPNINIPFHTIELGGVSIPIGLSYHARGVKVEEIASRVGIGWTLNAGGAITRKVRGNPDETPGFGYLSLNVYSSVFTNYTFRQNVSSSATYNYPEYDLIPDEFYFQAPGISGSFIINQINDQVLVKTFDDIVVSYAMENSKLSSFIITNSQGFKYYFGKSKDNLRYARDIETTIQNIVVTNDNPEVNGDDSFLVYNSWKLMDMEDPDGNTVTFKYLFEEPIFHRRSYDKLDSNIKKSFISKVRSKQYQISEILAQNTQVLFQKEFTIERQDLDNAYVLNEVKVYKGNSSLVKSYSLNYSYNNAPNNSNQLYYLETAEPKADKRLILNSVTEKGKTGSSKPPYTFTYNSTPLPNRFSNSQDYWGYYNGAYNGRYLTFFDYGSTTIDRSVNESKSMAGLLEKITYPTGGSTEFTYEHNIADAHRGDIANLIFPTVNPSTSSSENAGLANLEYQDYYNGTSYRKPFTIGQDVDGLITSHVSFGNSPTCSTTEYSPGCKFRIYVSVGLVKMYELFTGERDVSIPAGDYNLVVIPQGSHDPQSMDDSFFISLTWTEESQSVPQNESLYTSGKRIKKIESFDSNQNRVNFKEYEYTWDNGSSSGAILGMPMFYTMNETLSSEGFTVYEPSGSVPGSPLTTAQGNSVGYGFVTEFYGDKLNNIGKTEYEFSLTQDQGNFMSYPYHLPNDSEWLRGLPLATKFYRKNSDGTYSLLKKNKNEYKYAGLVPQDPRGFTPLMLEDEGEIVKPLSSNLDPGDTYTSSDNRYRFPLIMFYLMDPGDYSSPIQYKAFYLTGGTIKKYSSIETSYENAGSAIVTTTYFNYDFSKHYQLAESSVTVSDSEPITKTFKYTSDITNPTAIESNLAFKNRILPIETRTYKDLDEDGNKDSNELLSYQRNNYSDFGTGNIQIDNISTAKGNTNLESRIEYYDYDPQGNPLEVSQVDGAHVIYLWGYDNQYPIAKIENATGAQVSSILGTLSNVDETDFSAINNLRNSLPNAMVTTMEYDPLVGMTKTTDPKGLVTTFYYDNFNRLEFVKDQNGKLLKEHKYNYAN